MGSASNKSHDQVLDSVLVGPVSAGRHKFVFQAEAPNTAKIPPEDAVGVTVVLLTCAYKGCEFVRVGYYVNNEYSDPEMAENTPLKPAFEKVCQKLKKKKKKPRSPKAWNRRLNVSSPSPQGVLVVDVDLWALLQLQRNILASSPRVTKFKINWD